MGQPDTVAVGDAEDGRLRQEAVGPVLVCGEQAEQARARGQAGEQRAVIALQPALEGTLAAPFEHEQQGQGHHLARRHVRPRVVRDIPQSIIDTTEQLGDKIDGRHEALLRAVVSTPTAFRMPHDSVN